MIVIIPLLTPRLLWNIGSIIHHIDYFVYQPGILIIFITRQSTRQNRF
jgi:hypothetical protein